jgi:hypothetical protein
MSEITAFEILIDNLSKRGFVCETSRSENNFIIPGSDRLFNKKYVVSKINSSFFFAFDSYGTRAYSSETFSGLYTGIDLPEHAECQVFRKDRVDLFFRSNKCKTGNQLLDTILTITSKSGWTPKDLISEESALGFIELCKLIYPLKILIKNSYITTIKELNNKKVLGIESDVWIYKPEELYPFLEKGEKILESIKRACS